MKFCHRHLPTIIPRRVLWKWREKWSTVIFAGIPSRVGSPLKVVYNAKQVSYWLELHVPSIMHNSRLILVLALMSSPATWAVAGPSRQISDQAMDVLKVHCVKCHGPLKREGELSLASPRAIVRGGENGRPVVPGAPDQSLLWQRIAAGEMPPNEPLSTDDQRVIEQWIEGGAAGLPSEVPNHVDGEEHWSFQPLRAVPIPVSRAAEHLQTTLDRFIQVELQTRGLTFSTAADRHTLIRRVALDLTGLPPTPEEIKQFRNDTRPCAYETMVDRYLNSPRYGERWGKLWLDAAGYADSNGYFNADTDRPLAYRYRDYVIRSINEDKPWDQFIREQLAGDELVEYHDGLPLTANMVPPLEAVHFLRNSQDGTDSSDGNPDEVRIDRYTVLEGMLQIIGSSLFGVTLQCAKCHDHKFEPVTQRDYYQLQAIFYPAFNVEKWSPTAKREICTATPEELALWNSVMEEIDAQVDRRNDQLLDWVETHRERGTAIGAGNANNLAQESHWCEIDFALRSADSAKIAARRTIEVYALHADLPKTRCTIEGGGNAVTTVTIANGDQRDLKPLQLGTSKWPAGHHIGLRFVSDVNGGVDGRIRLAQVVDGLVEEGTVELPSEFSADATFTWKDPVPTIPLTMELAPKSVRSDAERESYLKELTERRKQVQGDVEQLQAKRPQKPGRLAFVTDLSPDPPTVPLLMRGNPKTPGDPVDAAAPHFLTDSHRTAELYLDATADPNNRSRTTGRRLAFARWLTQESPRAQALLARVTVNRWWTHHFGRGLVNTPDNLGYSGESPSHTELLEYLASEFVRSGWSGKRIHRMILMSALYRQSSRPTEAALAHDHNNQWLSRFPLRRLDAESIRDAVLDLSGSLDTRMFGPYVPTSRSDSGEVIVADDTVGRNRRSVYLQQRRTQVLGALEVFDAPAMVTNCTVRNSTTVPLQALQFLNAPNLRVHAQSLVKRIRGEVGDELDVWVRHAHELCYGRPPSIDELKLAIDFLQQQQSNYSGTTDAADKVWIDYCQMLLASNAFLYLH